MRSPPTAQASVHRLHAGRPHSKRLVRPIRLLLDAARAREASLRERCRIRLGVESSSDGAITFERAARLRAERRRWQLTGELARIRKNFKEGGTERPAGAALERERANGSLRQLAPLLSKLKTAREHGLSTATVEQSGFELLSRLHRGEKPGSNDRCPICFSTVGSSGGILSTPCVHLFCQARWDRDTRRDAHGDACHGTLRDAATGSAPQACHDAWFDGKQAMATAGDRWKPNCPVCRLEFWPGESIEVLPRKLPKPAIAASSAGPSSAGAGPSSANGGPSNSPNGPTYRDAYKRDDYRTLEPTDLAPISLAGLRSIRPDAAAHLLAATGLHPGSAAAASGGDVRSAKVARLLADLRNLGVDENGARRKAVVFSAHLSAIRHVETILQREGALPLFSLASNCDAAR